MKTKLLIICICLSGCASYNPVATKQGSIVTAHVADKVIERGIVKIADSINGIDNPYLHSVADALRAHSGDIINPSDVEKIAVDYGDPNNKEKFKTLGKDLFATLKNAVLQFGKVKGTELVAQGLNTAAVKMQKSLEGP